MRKTGYWKEAASLSWSNTTFFPWYRALPTVGAGFFLAYFTIGYQTLNQWLVNAAVLLGMYALSAGIEFAIRLFVLAPPKLLDRTVGEVQRLQDELRGFLGPRLAIIYEQRYPFDDLRTSSSYRLFRVGVRNVGIKTVEDLKVVVTDVSPRPEDLFPPLLLQAMHDRPSRRMTALHPQDTWYFDIVHQGPNGDIAIVQTVNGAGGSISPARHTVTISASGRNVPGISRRFVISIPTPRQGNQDLQFAPED